MHLCVWNSANNWPFRWYCNPVLVELPGSERRRKVRRFHMSPCSCRPLKSLPLWFHSLPTWLRDEWQSTLSDHKQTNTAHISFAGFLHGVCPFDDSSDSIISCNANLCHETLGIWGECAYTQTGIMRLKPPDCPLLVITGVKASRL